MSVVNAVPPEGPEDNGLIFLFGVVNYLFILFNTNFSKFSQYFNGICPRIISMSGVYVTYMTR